MRSEEPVVPEGTPAAQNAPALFVVFNLGSGANNAAVVRKVIESACAAAHRELHLMSVENPQQINDVIATAVKRAQERGGIVVAAGGDGTINAVAQAVLASNCAFGVLPQGTFNYFSRSHNIPSDTAQALQVILNGQPRDAQVGMVNDRVFLVNASLGLYPKLLEEREDWKHYLGRNRVVAFGAAISTLMAGHRSLRLQFELQGRSRKMRTPTLFVGNSTLQMKQLGFVLDKSIENGELAGIMLHPVRRLVMLGLLMRGALGQLGNSDRVMRFSFTRLRVNTAWPFRTRRIKVATDGEISWLTLPLEFYVSPKPLRLMQLAMNTDEQHSR